MEASLASVRTEGGKAEVQKEVFWSRDLLFLRANGPGARMEIPLDIDQDGYYELVAQVAHAPDYGDYRVLLDGKPVEPAGELEHEPGANAGGGALVNGWNSELYVAEDHLLGWKQLSRGHHTVTFVCAGKDARSSGYNLGIDTLIVARVASPEKTAPPRVPGTIAEMLRGLRDPDPVLRGVAALALRDRGAGLAEALPELAKALRDPETGVRMVAADAIARHGGAAVTVLDALIEAGKVEGENAHVQRSIALAMGAIGPAAARGIPVLESFEKIPRVRFTAITAKRRILVQPEASPARPNR